MKIVVLTVCLAWIINSKLYERIHTYSEYNRQWKEQVPTESVHDVSHLAVNDEDCGGEKCRFFYYERKDPSVTAGQKAVLLVAGMHGNEYLGPHALLYGYEHLRGAHIVFFPLANPSGFQRNQRLTHPGKVDPNRDFPVDGNRECYRSNAAHVLDFLLRKYEFAMTIVLRDGSEQIGFNWGTYTHMKQNHTPQYPIQKDIAEMMGRAGGSNTQLGIKQLAIGTIDEVINPVNGSLQDWAYAVGRYPEAITECTNFKQNPYLPNMASELVFVIEMGPHQSTLFGSSEAIQKPQDEDRADDGYVSRSIRMLREALYIFTPVPLVTWGQTQASIVFHGCKSVNLTSFDAIQIQIMHHVHYLLHEVNPIQLNGTLNQYKVKPLVLTYSSNMRGLNFISYFGQFQCINQWADAPQILVNNKRTIKFDLVLDKKLPKKPIVIDFPEDLITKSQMVLYGLLFIVLLMFFKRIATSFCCQRQRQGNQKTQPYEPNQTEQVDMDDDLYTARGGIIESDL